MENDFFDGSLVTENNATLDIAFDDVSYDDASLSALEQWESEQE